MAETAHMNSQPSTSYSTLYSLWGLSWLLLSLCRRDRLHWPIINTCGLRKFSPVSHAVSLLTYLILNNSTSCRAIAVIFSHVILRNISYLTKSIFYPYGAPDPYRVAPKTAIYTKFTIFDIPLYKICGGESPGYTTYFHGFISLISGLSAISVSA